MQASRTALVLLLAAAAAARAVAAQDAPPLPRELSAAELAVFRDPAFRTRFMDSYFSDTEIEPPISDPERERMQEVLDQIGKENLDRAIALLERSRQGDGSAVFDFTLGNLFFQQEQWDLALAAYGNAIEKHANFRRAWRNVALIRLRRSENREALGALTEVVRLGGTDAATFGLIGYCHSVLENHLPAESAYRMANLLDPSAMEWKMGLVRSFFRQQRYADAIALCGNLLAAEPERADLWLLQANAHLAAGQPLLAAANYEILDQLGASTFESLALLADVYVNEGLFEEGADRYLRALELPEAGDVGRPLRAARVMAARGASAAAKPLLTRLAEFGAERLDSSQRRELLQLQARIAMAEGAGEEERCILEELVRLDPLDGDALILLGQHAARAGDPAQAVFYYERAAGIESFEADAKVRHAQLLVGQGEYEGALHLLRRAQQIRPRDNVQEFLDQVERAARARG